MNMLITGGAGFVGSALALYFKNKFPNGRIVAFDNLHRRGSELNLPVLKKAGVEFLHGDIRHFSDLANIDGFFDVFLECSAEPSVMAGVQGSSRYVLDTNLSATINCLEFAKNKAGLFVFLSTSRVYSIEPLREIKLMETTTRFEIATGTQGVGVSQRGISEDFPTHLPRSFYGASKLCSEYLVQEYAVSYGLKAFINRFGVIAGPGQFGKADQGVFTLWVMRHFFGLPLCYTGFGGKGKQVRDLLHINDMVSFIDTQIEHGDPVKCSICNVGGGLSNAVSLAELTDICRNKTGNAVPIAGETATALVDIPLYISDQTKALAAYSWVPKQSVTHIVTDIIDWLKRQGDSIRASLC